MSAQATPRRARGKPRSSWLATGLALVAVPLGAQVSQYTAPGDLAPPDTPEREEMRVRMAAAPWHLGRWRLQPRLSIGDLEYSNNVFDENDETKRKSDLRGGAAAGLDAYVPLGSDFVGAVFVRPSYAWWRDNAMLRRLNWSYGAGIFGLFNRLSTELSVRRTETEQALNNELRIPTTTRHDRVAFDARVRVRGPWQLFGSVGAGETRYPTAAELEERAPNLGFLARNEDSVSLGVTYDVPGTFGLGVGWRQVDTSFVDDPDGRSSSGRSPFLSFQVPGSRLQLRGEIGQRRFDFTAGSSLRNVEEVVGSLAATLRLGVRTSVSAFGGRQIVYSGVDSSAYFASNRAGLALGWGDDERLRVRIFSQTGSDDFESGNGVNPGRVDDNAAYGLTVEVPLRWGLELRLGYTETEIDSNYDEFDRSLGSILSTVRLALPDLPF
ncbi:MAG: hypothetical protein OES32_13850 [Acidobacteriota bacterium]|nr:hypothetical protein [Acidobacteriota bacterium]MDH3524663.1 hypothetical protein [Acidobacteriota bacterium]